MKLIVNQFSVFIGALEPFNMVLNTMYSTFTNIIYKSVAFVSDYFAYALLTGNETNLFHPRIVTSNQFDGVVNYYFSCFVYTSIIIIFT